MRSQLLMLVLFITLFASCRTQRAVYNYLEDVNDTTFRKGVYLAETKIQKSDLLHIQVYSSSLDPAIDALYNLPGQTGAGASTGGGGSQSGQMNGYLVDFE